MHISLEILLFVVDFNQIYLTIILKCFGDLFLLLLDEVTYFVQNLKSK